MKTNTFSVIGGDRRSIFAANCLAGKDFFVKTFALGSSSNFSPQVTCCTNLADAISDSHFVLLPLPATQNGVHLFTPYVENVLPLDVLCQSVLPHQTVFGGKLPQEAKNTLLTRGIPYFDYAEREEFAVLNAIATSEGAIEIAMHETPCTLNNAECLVLGFGRIAKLLCRHLSGLGAKVTATARKRSDAAWINALGYHFFHIQSLKEHIGKFRVIFNTVPHELLTEEVLKNAAQNALIIDLASKPGGTNFKAANAMGIKTVHALSLPGKVAPETAGCTICETVLNILNEREVKP